MTLQPYQERVIQEKAELDLNIFKLLAFTGASNPVFSAMDFPDRDLLNRQCNLMQLYSEVLGQRIERFRT
jgi:hypothetical protein